jgi:TRAP-type C4-dicarboxylate transport system permease small subunit
MGSLESANEAISRVTQYVAALLMAAMTILVFLQVLFRYLLNSPLDWSEELASFALVWMALLGACVGLKKDEHPRLDLIISRLPQKTQRLIRILFNLAILSMLVLLAYYSLKLTVSMRLQLTAALQYSVSFVYAVLPVSATIMIIHLGVETIVLLRRREGNRNE